MPMDLSLAAIGLNTQQGGLSQILGSSNFWADFLHTAVPRVSSGETATFTRATTKTVNNNDGYLVTLLAGEIGFPGARRVRNHVSTTSEAFENAAWTKSNATVTSGFTDPNGGTTARRLQLTTGTGYLEQVISTIPTTSAACWALYMKSNTASSQTIGMYRNAVGSAKTVTTEWQRFSVVSVSAGGSNFYIQADGTTKDILIAWAQLEDVTAQVVQTAGEYVSVGVESAPYYHGSMVDGVKCFPTDLAGAALTTMTRYKPEPAAENKCLQSQTLDNASWTKFAGGGASVPVVTADQGVAPDGTMTADKVVFVAPVSGDISKLSAAPATGAGTYTGSIYIKAFAAGDVGKIIGFRHVASGSYTLITLTADWQRVSSTEVRATDNFDVTLRPSEGTSTGTVSFYAWGAMVELGSTATSYTPRGTAVDGSGTRNADALTYAGGNVANFKTLHAGFKPPAIVNAATNYTVLELVKTNITTESIVIRIQGGDLKLQCFVYAGSAVQANNLHTNVLDATNHKATASITTNSFLTDVDANDLVSDVSVTLPTGMTNLNVAVTHGSGSQQLNGNIGPVAAWTRNLSQSELGAIDA